MKYVFFALALVCLLPQVPAPAALATGIIFSLFFVNPVAAFTQKLTKWLLQLSIIGLGAGMNLEVIGKVGIEGIGYTVVGISLTMLLGILFGKMLSTDKETSLLLTVGTAICGGSAIAAVASAIRAEPQKVSVALVTVFVLNAVALFIFPEIGHFYGLPPAQFGLWSALAVHDTSSVVGAAVHYSAASVEVATTVKLARALWIVPVALLIGRIWNRKHSVEGTKMNYPWFILGFLLMAAIITWVPFLAQAGAIINACAKRTLVVTLFLIGSGLNRAALVKVGARPFIQGFCLWVVMASLTLVAIKQGWIE